MAFGRDLMTFEWDLKTFEWDGRITCVGHGDLSVGHDDVCESWRPGEKVGRDKATCGGRRDMMTLV